MLNLTRTELDHYTRQAPPHAQKLSPIPWPRDERTREKATFTDSTTPAKDPPTQQPHQLPARWNPLIQALHILSPYPLALYRPRPHSPVRLRRAL